MSELGQLHETYVHGRRVAVLCEQFAGLLPRDATVLDVGCGDGLLAALIQERRPDVRIRGIDVMVRKSTRIPVEMFDGTMIPCGDRGVDAVMLVDVLHHAEEPEVLLRDAVRVAAKTILLKDHTTDGVFAGSTLRLMDWVGNSRHGVPLPYWYWTRQQWLDVAERLQLSIDVWRSDLRLYPWPATLVFDRSLHFIARLNRRDA